MFTHIKQHNVIMMDSLNGIIMSMKLYINKKLT